MNTEFKTQSIAEFNSENDTKLTADMTFDEAMINIEENNVNYFYTSMNGDDVIEAVEDEPAIAEQLGLELINIYDLGIYIATYN